MTFKMPYNTSGPAVNNAIKILIKLFKLLRILMQQRIYITNQTYNKKIYKSLQKFIHLIKNDIKDHNMDDDEVKGNQYLAEALKKLKSSKSFFSGSIGQCRRSSRKEAIKLYTRAAHSFKMAKKWSAAGHAFCEVAGLQLKNGYKGDCGNAFVDAANCFEKSDLQKTINCLIKAIEMYKDIRRFAIAAKYHITIAEICETKCVDIEKAIKHYEQAADCYKVEKFYTNARRCLLNVARYSVQLEQYQKAIDIYERVANTCIKSPLLKYSAKDYYFRAALCHMCIDLMNAQLAVKTYEELYPLFTDSRECKLLKFLLNKLKENDVEGFVHAVKDLRLDQWFTNILLRVKKQIKA